MTYANRRSFITKTSVAAAAALAIVPGLTLPRFASNPSSLPALPVSAPTMSEPFAAYVRNAASGEISILIGTREVIVRDVNLVARLIQAAG
jgi:hypothetical protein